MITEQQTILAFEERTPREVRALIKNGAVNGLMLFEDEIVLDCDGFFQNIMCKVGVGRYEPMTTQSTKLKMADIFNLAQVIDNGHELVYEVVSNRCQRLPLKEEAIRKLYNMGAKRVVLARELSLDEIAEIRAKTSPDLDIETFVHGAMCVSFSGRCLISSYLTGRDANHGDCAQPCRWKYHLFEENRQGQYFPVEEENGGTYLYNSRDLCMIEHIPEMVKAGISSFKIEGRAKSAYYTAVTTNAYRHALDDYFAEGEGFTLKPWIKEELEKISHREYNTGFYFGGEPGQNTSDGGYIRHYDAVAVCLESVDEHTSVISQRNKFLVGDTLDVLPPSGIPFNVVCQRLVNADGEDVDSAPHPTEVLTMTSDLPIPRSSVIRKKKY